MSTELPSKMAEPHNKQAIRKELERMEIAFTDVQTDEGWVFDIIDVVEGQQIEDLVKVVDTSQNVVIRVDPNLGLSIGTSEALSSFKGDTPG